MEIGDPWSNAFEGASIQSWAEMLVNHVQEQWDWNCFLWSRELFHIALRLGERNSNPMNMHHYGIKG